MYPKHIARHSRPDRPHVTRLSRTRNRRRVFRLYTQTYRPQTARAHSSSLSERVSDRTYLSTRLTPRHGATPVVHPTCDNDALVRPSHAQDVPCLPTKT